MDIGGVGGRGLRQKERYGVNRSLISRGELSESEQKAWLSRSSTWSTMQANNYVGKRVLGAGANGTVGAWEHKGNSHVLPKLVVVKQCLGYQFTGPLRVESKLLRDIVGTDTNHIVKLYKSYHEEGGTGSSESKDPLPFTAAKVWKRGFRVSRIYLEYCTGSLESKMENIPDDQDLPEEYVWRVLECLASALVVLRHGNEDDRHDAPTWEIPIVHFDLKPANVLVGEHDNNAHPRLPVFKLADFGLALPLPPEVTDKELWDDWPERQQDYWTEEATWRCTPSHASPEQLEPHICGGRVGYRSDVWCVGAILYELMTKTIFRSFESITIQGIQRWKFRNDTFQRTDAFGTWYTTFGRDLIKLPYSKRLINLTHLCLARDPRRRPKPRQILRAVRKVIRRVYKAKTTKVQLNEIIPQSLHDVDRLIRRLTPTEIANNFGPLSKSHVFQPPQTDNDSYPVSDEDESIPLVPFANGQPLPRDFNSYPFQSVIQRPKNWPPKKSIVRTRHGKLQDERAARKFRGE